MLPGILARPNGGRVACCAATTPVTASPPWNTGVSRSTARPTSGSIGVGTRSGIAWSPSTTRVSGLRRPAVRMTGSTDYLVREDIPGHASVRRARPPGRHFQADGRALPPGGAVAPAAPHAVQAPSDLDRARCRRSNRCLLGQFVASTGRNAHQAGKFIFGPSRWLRNLIKPPSRPRPGLSRLDRPRSS